MRKIPSTATAVHKMMATPEYDKWLDVAAHARAAYSETAGVVYREGVEQAVALSAMANSGREAQIEAAISTLRRYEFRSEVDDDEALVERR